MKLLIVLFAFLAVVLNIIMPAFGMNPVCNCNKCPEVPSFPDYGIGPVCNCKPCTRPYAIDTW